MRITFDVEQFELNTELDAIPSAGQYISGALLAQLIEEQYEGDERLVAEHLDYPVKHVIYSKDQDGPYVWISLDEAIDLFCGQPPTA